LDDENAFTLQYTADSKEVRELTAYYQLMCQYQSVYGLGSAQ